MDNKFISVSLDDIGDIITGRTPKTNEKDNYGNDYMFVTPTDLHKHFLIKKSERMVSTKGLESIKSAIIDDMSILVGCIGWDMGNVGLVQEKCITNQQINAITNIKDDFNPYYIYYLLKGKKDFFFQQASVTRTPILRKSVFSEIRINVPNKKYQDKIASILSTLDKKIELNNQINQKLESMAKTLYDYWFVQFDFPDANGNPYKNSGGKMVYSEELKREIPEGWESASLESLVQVTKGGDWGKENIEDNFRKEVFCIRGADFNGLNGKGELKAPKRYISEKNTNKLLVSHDVIIEISGGSPTQSTGRLTFVTEETLSRFDKPIVCSNFCRAISLNEEKDLYYFIHTWNLLYDNNVMFGWEGKTSGLKNLLMNNMLKAVNITIPSSDLIDKFYGFNKPLQAKKQKNLIENQKLTQLRDLLLPMLMNGQVGVESK